MMMIVMLILLLLLTRAATRRMPIHLYVQQNDRAAPIREQSRRVLLLMPTDAAVDPPP